MNKDTAKAPAPQIGRCYWFHDGETAGGLLSLAELHELIERGGLTTEDFFWYEGLTDWVPIALLPPVPRPPSRLWKMIKLAAAGALILSPLAAWFQWGHPHSAVAAGIEQDWKNMRTGFEFVMIRDSPPVFYTEHGECYHTRKHYKDRSYQTSHFEAIEKMGLRYCEVCTHYSLRNHTYPAFPVKYPANEIRHHESIAQNSLIGAVFCSVVISLFCILRFFGLTRCVIGTHSTHEPRGSWGIKKLRQMLSTPDGAAWATTWLRGSHTNETSCQKNSNASFKRSGIVIVSRRKHWPKNSGWRCPPICNGNTTGARRAASRWHNSTACWTRC